MDQLKRLDVNNGDMSHDAGCGSPVKRSIVRQEVHWAEKSTPLLGRRGKRNSSPTEDDDDDDDEDGTLAILPLAVKRRNMTRSGAVIPSHDLASVAPSVLQKSCSD
jgi:hypothetical protein